eukprot:3263207-Pyramimonas_sp.AAC.1
MLPERSTSARRLNNSKDVELSRCSTCANDEYTVVDDGHDATPRSPSEPRGTSQWAALTGQSFNLLPPLERPNDSAAALGRRGRGEKRGFFSFGVRGTRRAPQAEGRRGSQARRGRERARDWLNGAVVARAWARRTE